MNRRWTGRVTRAEPPEVGMKAEPPGFTGIRFFGEHALPQFDYALPPAAESESEALRILALSGGGAGGAFGAGALTGLSKAGRRPKFHMVTGVSTGALIAPLAFLGPAWDYRLADAYAGGGASDLLALSGLRPGPSLYASEPLASLVRRYVDPPLLQAVGAAHRDGRRLFVATADLDQQAICIWDLGAIARQDGETAANLFADLLIASASLPGLFPPKMIEVESEGRRFEEMHVDGGTVTPLFLVPETMIHRRLKEWGLDRVEIYALVNTALHPPVRATPLSAAPILVRSFELMLRSSYRNALEAVAVFSRLNGYALYTAAVPAQFGAVSMLHFDQPLMSGMFSEGAALAESGQLWSQGA